MAVIVGRKGGKKGFTKLLKFTDETEAKRYIKSKAHSKGGFGMVCIQL